MDWKKERDELIAQTLAFVQSVSVRMPETAQWKLANADQKLPPAAPPPEITAAPHVQAAPEPPARPAAPPPSPASSPAPGKASSPASSHAPAPSPVLPPTIHSEVEQEFRARIASFRAHQERFNRERAEYCDATISRLRATLQDVPRPGPGQITHPRGTA
jgi:hypothetical protein